MMSIAWKQLETGVSLCAVLVGHPQTKRGAIRTKLHWTSLLVELDFVVLGLEDVGTPYSIKSPY